MKRYIVISLLCAAAVKLLACAGPDIKNYYVFSAYAHGDWNHNVQELCNNNWLTYLDSKDEYFYFDADEVIAAARKKGDQLMVSYVRNLRLYLDCAEAARTDVWDYPTKQQLTKRRQTLNTVANYARQKLGTRLRSQHGLLLMRCQMMLGQHLQNVTFWEQTANRYINSVYRDMMQNIYAGALLKTGRIDEATAIFMQQGDTESLYTYYYKKRSCQAITDEYQRNPQSPALPFLVQDFVNNTQEAADFQHDGEYAYWPGKLFIRDINDAERRQMCQLCSRVISEGKTRQPVMWQSAKAWLEYLGGEYREAQVDIAKALTMDGTDYQRDNARMLHLFITASTTPSYNSQFDNFLAEGLQWLEDKERVNSEEFGAGFSHSSLYMNVYNRLTRQVLVPRYSQQQRYTTAVALLGAFDETMKHHAFDIEAERQFIKEYKWNPDYNDDFFRHIDTLQVDRLEAYLTYINSTPQTPLDQWLHRHVRHDANFLADLIGTKYLRLAQWQKAAEWLARVPMTFINKQNITPYAVSRSYTVERWLKKQNVKNEEPGSVQATKNIKLEFVSEMQQLEDGLSLLNGTERQQRAYQLAVRYYQASYLGQCWFLTRYGNSALDTARVNESDFVAHAAELLHQAAATTDVSLRERSLYALAFMPIGGAWQVEEWDDRQSKFVMRPRTQSHQYRALSHLSDFAAQNPTQLSAYVSRCDVLKQFNKQYRKK